MNISLIYHFLNMLSRIEKRTNISMFLYFRYNNLLTREVFLIRLTREQFCLILKFIIIFIDIMKQR